MSTNKPSQEAQGQSLTTSERAAIHRVLQRWTDRKGIAQDFAEEMAKELAIATGEMQPCWGPLAASRPASGEGAEQLCFTPAYQQGLEESIQIREAAAYQRGLAASREAPVPPVPAEQPPDDYNPMIVTTNETVTAISARRLYEEIKNLETPNELSPKEFQLLKEGLADMAAGRVKSLKQIEEELASSRPAPVPAEEAGQQDDEWPPCCQEAHDTGLQMGRIEAKRDGDAKLDKVRGLVKKLHDTVDNPNCEPKLQRRIYDLADELAAALEE